jgi:WD40 repeat protein
MQFIYYMEAAGISSYILVTVAWGGFGSAPGALEGIVSKHGDYLYCANSAQPRSYPTSQVIGGYNVTGNSNIGTIWISPGVYSSLYLATGAVDKILYVSEPQYGYVGVWDMSTRTMIDRINISWPMALMVDPGSEYLYVQTQSSPIKITKFRLSDKANLGSYTLNNTTSMSNPHISPDGSMFLFGDDSYTLKLYYTSSFTPVRTLGAMHWRNVYSNFDVDDNWTYAYAAFNNGVDRINLKNGVVDQQFVSYNYHGNEWLRGVVFYNDRPSLPDLSITGDDIAFKKVM